MNIDNVLKSHGVGVGSGSSIKSIQRISGIFDVTQPSFLQGGVNFRRNNFSINEVDVTKTICIFNTINPVSSNNGSLMCKLTSSTNVEITDIELQYAKEFDLEIIEFCSVKSLQNITLQTLNNTSGIINSPISKVNVSKAFITMSYAGYQLNSYANNVLKSILETSTNIRTEHKSLGGATKLVNIQVLELN